MKIAFSGPSGAGKTTLCKYVEETFGYRHLSTSASDVLSPSNKTILSNMGWEKKGHMSVIEQSIRNPKFALSFQDFLLEDRLKQIKDNKAFVIDRCPIDNLVYRLMQAAWHDNWYQFKQFYDKAIEGLHQLDLIIFVEISEDVPEIEDNKSRIANWHFQKYVSEQFRWMISSVLTALPSLNIKTLSTWDLDTRKRKVYTYIKELETSKLFNDENI